MSSTRRTVLAVRHADVAAATASRLDPASLPSRAWGLFRAEHVVGHRTRTDGPALRLQLSSGRQVVLTLPREVAVAADAINEHLPVSAPGAS